MERKLSISKGAVVYRYLKPAVILQLILILAASYAGFSQTLSTRDARYELRPGDVIGIQYRYTPEYNATVSIQPDGFASLPLLGDTKLAGLSLDQAHAALVAKAEQRLNEPELTLELKEFEKPHYIVGGEVGAPGRFEWRGRVTALQAVEMAGGFKNSAKASQILLIRPTTDQEGQTRLIDLKKVIDKRQLDEDIDIRPGDMLFVPKNRLSKIEPYVKLANTGLYFDPFTF